MDRIAAKATYSNYNLTTLHFIRSVKEASSKRAILTTMLLNGAGLLLIRIPVTDKDVAPSLSLFQKMRSMFQNSQVLRLTITRR